MKWITEITLNNFRAFGTPETIKIPKGNHLLIYGENGSGKSSIYNALKDFFSSSVAGSTTTYKLNLFEKAKHNETGSVSIKVEEDGQDPKEYKFTEPDGDSNHRQSEIFLANKFKGFLDYKRMLKVHSLEIPDDKTPNLFELIARELLNEHRIADPRGGVTTIEFLKEYIEIATILTTLKYDHALKTEAALIQRNEEIVKELGGMDIAGEDEDAKPSLIAAIMDYESEQEKIKDALKILEAKINLTFLDKEFRELLKKVLEIANDYLGKYFQNKISLDAKYTSLGYAEATNKMTETLSFKILYAGKEIEFYQAFLNEARLSALAVSIYLASIKTFNPSEDSLKVLYLDDVFIGLDTSNRFPLLEIINDKFVADGFQLFISTYDREWFELSRHWFQIKVGSGKIKSLELFIEDDGNPNTPDYPVIIPYDGNLAKAKALFKCKDYPAAGNYLRKECEGIIKTYLPETFKVDDKGKLIDELESLMQKLEEFFDVSQIAKPQELIDAIKIYRRALLNPTSHSDIKSPLFKKEIDEAFKLVDKLKALPEIKWTQIYTKGDTFTYTNLGSHYSMQIELADHLYLSVQGVAKTFSKHRFRIKTWTRNTVEFAIDEIGTVMQLPAREHVCEQTRTLEEIFHGIHQSTGIAIPPNLYAEIKIGGTGTLNDFLQI